MTLVQNQNHTKRYPFRPWKIYNLHDRLATRRPLNAFQKAYQGARTAGALDVKETQTGLGAR